MSQRDIIELFKKHNNLTTEDIKKYLKIGYKTINVNLLKLTKEKLLKRKVIKKSEEKKHYNGRRYRYSRTKKFEREFMKK